MFLKPTRDKRTHYSLSLSCGPQSGSPSTFTENVSHTTAYIGEGVRFMFEGDGGHTGYTNEHRDIWLEMDVGEPSATFTAHPLPLNIPMDATKFPGRYGAHAYATTGTKNWTLTSWTFGSGIKVQTGSVTIINPDDETWDIQWYYDPDGDTTGFPAADASHVHLTSESVFASARRTTSVGDKARLHIRTGKNIPIETVQTWDQAADVVYVNGFGGGEVTFVDNTPTSGLPTDSATDMTLFAPHASAVTPKWILNNIKVTGSYDPITGHHARSKIVLAKNNGVVGTSMTAWRCTAIGCSELMSGGGNIQQEKAYNMCWLDCIARGNQNYVLGFSGVCNHAVARGCLGFQDNLAVTGDTKPGTVQDYPDHAFLRVSRFWRMAVLQNISVARGGWTGSGYSEDFAAQPFLRAYSAYAPAGHKGNVIMNRTCGRFLAEFGRAAGGEIISNAPSLLVMCNDHDFNHQGAMLVKSHVGGIHILCNTLYRPPLESDSTGERAYFLFMNGAALGAGDDPNNTYAEPCTVQFNTYVYDGDAGFEHTPSSITETEEQTGDGSTPVVATGSNIIAATGVSGGGPYTSISALARGDKFRPITAGAAVSTASTGPPVDIDGTQRSNPTNIGAHHTHGANVSVGSPSFSGATQLTIAENPYEAGDYLATVEGTVWTIPDDPFEGGMLDVTWTLNGVDVANRHNPVYRGGGTGNLVQVQRKTNRSGVTASSTSNTLAI